MTHAGTWATEVLARCDAIARFSDEPGRITRTFLSEATRSLHRYLCEWMETLGMAPSVDGVGNVRGLYPGQDAGGKRLLIGSHIDTVPDAGRYDGVLGVVLGLTLIEMLQGRRFPFAIEVVAFSEEEGVRFGVPFIGSRALVGDLGGGLLARSDAAGISVEEAIRHFGLNPDDTRLAMLHPSTAAYLEFHIEQGPVLESLNSPLGVVEAIVGQSRGRVVFSGSANHAGTTPMQLRRDALCAAAQWVCLVETRALDTDDLVATVGQLEVKPNVGNVIPGEVMASIDVRHASDTVRQGVFTELLEVAGTIARERGLTAVHETLLEQPAVPMDPRLINLAMEAAEATNVKPHRMVSGAGHDAMILARKVPCAMIFLRSPGGVSHHPDEAVLPGDVALALQTGLNMLENLAQCTFLT